MTPAQLPADAPEWVRQALAAGQPVVVRRAMVAVDQLAIGVRGASRDQRYATVMPRAAVRRCVHPEQLVERLPVSTLPALKALVVLRPFLDDLGLPWGVTGSVGYQLATDIETVHADSDLDLLLRTPQPLSRQIADELQRQLDKAACRVDMQLETPLGGIALREWAGSSTRVLLKCATGARLVDNPWDGAPDQPERAA
jgi:phosphoribosyl-dephospho-CoA transferase